MFSAVDQYVLGAGDLELNLGQGMLQVLCDS
jgi:hypothetical protein